MDEIRVGLIGAGANTRRRHIPGLLAQKGIEIVAVANRSEESSEKAATEISAKFEVDKPKVASSWLEIIDDEEIDAVCIGTWPYMHAPMTIAALEAGKHVLVEARMAMNGEEAREMLAVSRANPDLAAQIVPAPHTLPVDRAIIDHINQGYIGELINARVQIGAGSSYPNPGSPLHWRHDRDLSGNNVMTMGIWYEIIMRWLGPAVSAQALGQVVVKHRKDDSGRSRAITIPDHIDILCDMARGGTLNMSVTTVSSFVPPQDVWIHGTEGTLHLETVESDDPGQPGLRLSGARRGDKAMAEIQVAPEKRGHWRVEEEFVNVINGVEQVTHTNFSDGVRYMEWSDAVTESCQTGEKVKLVR